MQQCQCTILQTRSRKKKNNQTWTKQKTNKQSTRMQWPQYSTNYNFNTSCVTDNYACTPHRMQIEINAILRTSNFSSLLYLDVSARYGWAHVENRWPDLKCCVSPAFWVKREVHNLRRVILELPRHALKLLHRSVTKTCIKLIFLSFGSEFNILRLQV